MWLRGTAVGNGTGATGMAVRTARLKCGVRVVWRGGRRCGGWESRGIRESVGMLGGFGVCLVPGLDGVVDGGVDGGTTGEEGVFRASGEVAGFEAFLDLVEFFGTGFLVDGGDVDEVAAVVLDEGEAHLVEAEAGGFAFEGVDAGLELVGFGHGEGWFSFESSCISWMVLFRSTTHWARQQEIETGWKARPKSDSSVRSRKARNRRTAEARARAWALSFIMLFFIPVFVVLCYETLSLIDKRRAFVTLAFRPNGFAGGHGHRAFLGYG
jgi:hypothetical protein